MIPLRAVANGALELPVVGSLLVWALVDFVGSAGHMAVVVRGNNNHVDIVEQNWQDNRWPDGQAYSRRLQVIARQLESLFVCLVRT